MSEWCKKKLGLPLLPRKLSLRSNIDNLLHTTLHICNWEFKKNLKSKQHYNITILQVKKKWKSESNLAHSKVSNIKLYQYLCIYTVLYCISTSTHSYTHKLKFELILGWMLYLNTLHFFQKWNIMCLFSSKCQQLV